VRKPKIIVLDRADALAGQVRSVAERLPTRPDVTACSQAAEVADLLTAGDGADVLVAGPSLATRAGLARLELIHDELPGVTKVLAFARPPDAHLRDVVRTGASDLLQLPASDEDLSGMLQRALDLAGKSVRVATTVPAASPTRGRVFTISSATGGCGKTFYATNLAAFLRHHTGQRVCVVDIDLQFGEVSTAMRLRPKYTIYDALERDEGSDAELEAHIEEYLVEHETGVMVLAAPKDPAEADRIKPPDVTRIVEALRNRFDIVIVDTPAQLSEAVLAAFDLSERLYVMATLDLPSVRNMSVFLHTLDKLKIPSGNVRLVLNKAESDVGLEVAKIEKLFTQGFSSVLPYAKEVSKSINLGMPVLMSSPGADVSKRMAAGMIDLLPEGTRPAMAGRRAAPAGGGRLFRLFRRHAAPATSPELSQEAS
jgi:pilus assembly protein CpaE